MVRADLPGMDLGQISVAAKGNTLAISGCRSFQADEKAKEHMRLERLHGNFICELHLPGIVSNPKIEVAYKAGVLEIEVPIM